MKGSVDKKNGNSLTTNVTFMENPLVSKLINKFMKSGKKVVSEKIVCGASEMLYTYIQNKAEDIITSDGTSLKTLSEHSLVLFVINAISPSIEVKSKRVGGANYQIPIPVKEKRALALACTWLVAAVAARSERGAVTRLYHEMIDIINGRGFALKKKNEVHKMAEANKAFAHFANKL